MCVFMTKQNINDLLKHIKMKKLTIILISIFVTAHLMSQDLNADQIVANYLKAVGQEKYNSMETVKITGKVTQQGLEIRVTDYQKKPDKDRAEMEVQGLKVIMTVEGDAGWIINPMMGINDAQDLDAESIKAMKKEGNSDPTGDWDSPFINSKEKDINIELEGMEDVNGSPAYNLKFTFKEGYFINYIIDAKTFLLLRSKSTQNVQGQTYDSEVRFSDYKEFEGIRLPGKYEVLVNGQVGQVGTLESCEFNIPVDDSLFNKPVKN